MITTHGKVTIKDQLVSAASFKRMSKNQLIGQILAREATLARYELALKDVIELSEGSPSSYRDFADIAQAAFTEIT